MGRMEVTVQKLQALRPTYANISLEWPGYIAVTPDTSERVYITGEANESFTVDVYENQDEYARGDQPAYGDLKLLVKDSAVTADVLAGAFLAFIEASELVAAGKKPVQGWIQPKPVDTTPSDWYNGRGVLHE